MEKSRPGLTGKSHTTAEGPVKQNVSAMGNSLSPDHSDGNYQSTEKIILSTKHDHPGQSPKWLGKHIVPRKIEGNSFRNRNDEYTEKKMNHGTIASQNIRHIEASSTSNKSLNFKLDNMLKGRRLYPLEVTSPYRNSRLLSKFEGSQLLTPQVDSAQKAIGNSSASALREKVRERNTRELSRLFEIKINQERTRQKILHPSPQLFPAPKQNGHCTTTFETNESVISRKDAPILEDLNFEPHTDAPLSTRQKSTQPEPETDKPQHFIHSESGKEKPILPPLKIHESNSTKNLYELMNNKNSYQTNPSHQKIKHQLKSEKVSELAKALIHTGSNRFNYNKLLHETFEKDNNDNTFHRQPETESFEQILEHEMMRSKSKRRQEKYDFLLKMDIARKMAPVNNAISQYRVIFLNFEQY